MRFCFRFRSLILFCLNGICLLVCVCGGGGGGVTECFDIYFSCLLLVLEVILSGESCKAESHGKYI